MLNQTNIVNANNNKFIKTQIVTLGTNAFYHWRRWGRVGAVGQSMLEGEWVEAGCARGVSRYECVRTCASCACLVLRA